MPNENEYKATGTLVGNRFFQIDVGSEDAALRIAERLRWAYMQGKYDQANIMRKGLGLPALDEWVD